MITYQTTIDGITEDQLNGFFVGWPNSPDNQKFLSLLNGSDYVVLAIDDETTNVVGFITAISDNVLSAYLPLLEVRPDFQKQGIGGELVTRMMRRLEHLYMIDLACDLDLHPFYARFGLKPLTGMMLRNFDRQGG